MIKMAPMSNAERQKKYREKLKKDKEKYEEKKKKHREYMKTVRKPIAEMSEREKENKRREWRNAKKKQNDVGVTKAKKNKCCEYNARLCAKLKKLVADQKKFIENMSLQRQALQKQLYRNKNTIRKLRESIANPGQNKTETVENISTDRVSLINSSQRKTNSAPEVLNIGASTSSSGMNIAENEIVPLYSLIESPNTPLTKTMSFINENIPFVSTPEKNKVKKQILQLNVINTSLQTAYDKHDNKSKRILKDIVSSETVEKYNLKTEISKTLGLKGRLRKYKKKNRTYKEEEKIRAFFNRDDNSKMSAGKKECVGRGNDKLQKRYLLSSLKKLYTKYVREEGKASFSTFRRNKPRNVVRPKLSDRNTVACIKHSNLAFKVAHLKKIGVIGTSDLEEILAMCVCSIESYDCMYFNCEKCKNTIPEMNLTQITNDTECTWIQWVRKEFTFEKGLDRKTTTTKKYVKDIIKDTFSKLKDTFLTELHVFRQHYFNISHQHKKYREIIDNLKPNEVALIIDFSENYCCKLNEEIQALHFGASKGQITIHTGMAYLHNKKIPFASLSDCNVHDPGAIRAHIEPVIELLIKLNPDIDIIHFFSDGPSTQYKQKKNFYQMTELCKKYKLVFGTWSFFEAAHGKGAADGVGGAVKRLLDQNVACGNDVTCADDAISILNEESSVKIFSIPESVIRHAQNEIPDDLEPVPGTNRLHQVTYHVPSSTLRYRDVSCFCESSLPRGTCGCYNPKTHSLKKDTVQNENASRNIKKRKIGNRATKKSKLFHDTDSTTSTDSHITYAESNDSYTFEDEQFLTNDSYKNISFSNTVTKLSDVKNTAENKAYCDLSSFLSLEGIVPQVNIDLKQTSPQNKSKKVASISKGKGIGKKTKVLQTENKEGKDYEEENKRSGRYLERQENVQKRKINKSLQKGKENCDRADKVIINKFLKRRKTRENVREDEEENQEKEKEEILKEIHGEESEKHQKEKTDLQEFQYYEDDAIHADVRSVDLLNCAVNFTDKKWSPALREVNNETALLDDLQEERVFINEIMDAINLENMDISKTALLTNDPLAICEEVEISTSPNKVDNLKMNQVDMKEIKVTPSTSMIHNENISSTETKKKNIVILSNERVYFPENVSLPKKNNKNKRPKKNYYNNDKDILKILKD